MWWKDRLQNRLKRPTILSPTNQHQCNTNDYKNATVLVALGFSILTCPQWSQGVNQQSLSLRHPISVSQKNSQNVWQCNGKQSLGWMQKKMEKFLPISHNDGIECLWEWALSYIFPGHRALPGTGHSMTECICVQRKRKRVVFLFVTNKLRL